MNRRKFIQSTLGSLAAGVVTLRNLPKGKQMGGPVTKPFLLEPDDGPLVRLSGELSSSASGPNGPTSALWLQVDVGGTTADRSKAYIPVYEMEQKGQA